MLSAMKNVVLGAMGAAGLIALASVLDMVTGFPFTGKIVMDILYLIAAATVIYMGYDAYKDMG